MATGDDDPTARAYEVILGLDGEVVLLDARGEEAAEALADRLLTAAEERSTVRLVTGHGPMVVNFAVVGRTTVAVQESTGGAMGIKR
jgi:hypothetical protein